MCSFIIWTAVKITYYSQWTRPKRVVPYRVWRFVLPCYVKINKVSVSGWSPIGCGGFHANLNIPSPLPTTLVFRLFCRVLICVSFIHCWWPRKMRYCYFSRILLFWCSFASEGCYVIFMGKAGKTANWFSHRNGKRQKHHPFQEHIELIS